MAIPKLVGILYDHYAKKKLSNDNPTEKSHNKLILFCNKTASLTKTVVNLKCDHSY